MARGGARSGAPGKAYANRSDLSGPPKLPPTAVPGQPYGAAGAQLAAQAAVPMGPSPAGTAQAAPPQGPPSPGGGAPPITPGGLGHIARPSERPGEHVMTGVGAGPGPGPEAIPGYQAPTQTLGGLLSSLASTPSATPEVRGLAAFVNQGRL